MSEEQDVTVRVDTHKDVHVAAVLDQTGRVLGTRGFPTTMRGYAQHTSVAVLAVADVLQSLI